MVLLSASGILDNHQRGKVGEFLAERIRAGAELSFVSAYFTIYAYEALRSSSDDIGRLRFLFGEPRFVNTLDPSKIEEKAFSITEDRLGSEKPASDRRRRASSQ